MDKAINVSDETYNAYVLLERIKNLSKISSVSIKGSHEGFSNQNVKIEDFEEVFKMINGLAKETEEIVSNLALFNEVEPV